MKSILEEIHVVQKLESLPLMMTIVGKIKDNCSDVDVVTLDNFLDIALKNPSLMAPIFLTQEKVFILCYLYFLFY